ncbi:MAG: glycosyltransferase family 4 protein [Candidatus Promineofilum sp.]|nr:glycosyltransferase family 4 protein [Promineifilum sp.]
MRLLIISHTPHYHAAEGVVGWGPTVRELDYLAALFDQVTHVAVGYPGQPPASALPYAAPNLRVRLVAPTGGESWRDKLGILTAYPAYARVLREEISRADAVHVRCPANISLLALRLLERAPEPRYRWVKFAGNWQPEGHEPWSYRWQRRWLTENRHRGVVTVNGRWPGQPAHVHTFDNPCLTDEEIAQGGALAAARPLHPPAELLFVGELNEGKGVGRVLRVAQLLQARGVPFRLRLLGDGPDRPRYEAWAHDKGLNGVSFLGWVPRAEVAGYYAAAHFILLPSRSEGWPKVLSEAMAYGVVPVAAAVSSIPQILGETGAGVSLAVDDVEGMAEAITRFVADPEAWAAAGRAGVAAAPRFTYRAYQAAVAGLFAGAWGIQLSSAADPEPLRSVVVASTPEAGVVAPYSSNGYH